MRTVLTLTLGAALLQQYPIAPPPRDSRAPATARDGTGVIKGRVYDRETGAPIPNVSVTLMAEPVLLRESTPSTLALINRPAPPRQIRTDAQGRFVFDRLPAATYFVNSNPPEFKVTYLPQVYGSARPTDVTRPPARRPIVLADGQTLDNVDLPL